VLPIANGGFLTSNASGAFDPGAHTFGGGKGSLAGSGLSLPSIALSVRMRGEHRRCGLLSENG